MAAIDWSIMLSISTAIMACAITITAIYAGIQLLNIKRARCSDLLMRLLQTWGSNDYNYSRRIINQHGKGSTLEEGSQNLRKSLISFDEEDAEEYFIMVRVANFFENLGYLTCKGLLHRDQALELFGGSSKRYWGLFHGFADFLRNESENKLPDTWVYFEYLALGCKKKNRCQHFVKTPIWNIYNLVSKNTNRE